MTTNTQDWYWSQQGATLGPIDLAELRRLVATGSVTPSTWVYAPERREWVRADSVEALFPPPGSGSSPSAPPPDARTGTFCQFCGAKCAPGSPRCDACGRERSTTTNIDPKVAEVVCRACVFAMPLISVLAFIGPAIMWSLGSSNPRVVAEAKQAINCQLTVVIAFVVSLLLTLIAIGILGLIAIPIYCIVVGILGLVASSNGREFRYPLAIPFLR